MQTPCSKSPHLPEPRAASASVFFIPTYTNDLPWRARLVLAIGKTPSALQLSFEQCANQHRPVVFLQSDLSGGYGGNDAIHMVDGSVSRTP